MDLSERLKSGFGFNVYEAIFFGIIFFFMVLLWNDKWQRRRFEKLAAKLSGPKDYPIVGNGFEFIGSTEQVFKSILKIHHEHSEPILKVWLGSSFLVSITKPVDVQVILNSSKVLEKSNFYKIFKYGRFDGLLFATAEKWRRTHRLIAPIFKNNQNEFLDVFNKKNQILVERLKTEINKTQPLDLWKYISFHNLTTLCQNVMNYNLDVQCDEADEFNEAITKLAEWDSMRIMKPWLYPDIIFSIYINLTGKAKFFKILKKLPKKLIQEKKNMYVHQKEVKQSNTDTETNDKYKRNKSFLDMLLELNENGAQLMTDKEVEDEIITIMIAGTETTAITVCSCLLLLAMHQHIQEQVYDEIYKVLGDSEEIITMDQAFNLVYLEQVIKETLRIYPTTPFFARETQDDFKLVSSNLVLPKGTTCVFSPFVIHRLPELYPDPLSFNPENFTAENIAKRHKYSYIPFSGGPRNCVGSKYAMLSMKAQLATILRNYSVHTSLKMSEVRLEWKMLLRHVTGFPVTIQSRNRVSTHREF